MKYKNIQNIDFENKEIVGTEYGFHFWMKERPKDWTIDDELLMLSLYIQNDLIYKQQQSGVYKLDNWRTGISKVVHETMDKFEDDSFVKMHLYDYSSCDPTWEAYVTHHRFANGSEIHIDSIDMNRNTVNTPKGAEDYEKYQMFQKAKQDAKAELLAEQERAKAIEEAEAEEQAETEDVDIVIPFRNYGK